MGDIDEGLYSRQLYVLGRDAMRRVAGASVLVSGMGGVGAEVAKNLALGGVGSLTLHDTRLCRPQDLGAQFLLADADVGLNRAAASAPRVAELNGHVAVRACTCALTDTLVRRFDVVVLTESPLEEQLRLSETTHDAGVALVVADARGPFAQLFCDMGERHRVLDADGEPPPTSVVVSIAPDGVVTTAEETPHGLHEGDAAHFREAPGGPSLPVRRVLGPYQFSVGEAARALGAYQGGGVVTRAEAPRDLEFEPLRRALFRPEFEPWAERPWQLHLAFVTLHRYVQERGAAPGLWDERDAGHFVRLAFAVRHSVKMPEDADAAFMSLFARTAGGVLAPVCSVVGGVAAQEVMKAVSGKFTPVRQWLYLDASTGLVGDARDDEYGDAGRHRGGRHELQAALLGGALQSALEGWRLFVVGAGAVGCEVLKNVAMMGVATAGAGLVTVADDDHIERSNLNRQLLFRPHDVGRPKAGVAALAVAAMNPAVRVEAQEDAVTPDTEGVFGDEFFERQDGVVMALDSVAARLYVDRRCVYYRVPALEAGTLGAKGSTQVVVPFVTEAYGSSQDPPERAVAVCTLRNFPTTPDHALQWARQLFDAAFRDEPAALRRYVTLQEPPAQSDAENLETLRRALAAGTPSSLEDCVAWARRLWQELFSDGIRHLLHVFPPDSLTASGRPFWAPPRRTPRPLAFDADDALHLDFVFAASNLRARVFGLPETPDRRRVALLAAAVAVPPYEPPRPDVSGGAEAPLPPPPAKGDAEVTPIEFEKDDDENLHVDLVTAAANLRGACYGLEASDRLTAKLVAGRIVPAIATTTAVVAGLLCLELCKVARRGGVRSTATLRNHFVNLALPLFCSAEPVAARREPLGAGGGEWTLWDRFDVAGDMTLADFLRHFRDAHGLTVTMVSHGVCMLYSSYLPEERTRDRLPQPLANLIESVSRRPLEPHVRAVTLELSCNDADGNDVDVPYVRYALPPR